MSEREITIDELADEVGVSVRTIRFYIAQGLLAGPSTRGKGASYSEEQLRRLRLIRLLVEQHIPLAEVKDLLDRLSPQESRSLLEEEQRRAHARQAEEQAPSPKAYITGLLESARAMRQPTPPSPPAPRLREKARGTQATQPNELQQNAGESWRRIELTPGVELHIQQPMNEQQRYWMNRILALKSESAPKSEDEQ